MPLNSTNYSAQNGHLIHQDILDFFNLFTGVMTDQPVNFQNTVRAGGVLTAASDVIVGGAVKFGTSGAATETLYKPSAGNLRISAALTVDGGLTAPTFVATTSMTSPTYIVGTNATPASLHGLAAQPQWAVLESPASLNVIEAKGGSYLSGNLYHDGTQWNRYDTSQGGMMVGVTASNIYFYATPAGANPASLPAPVAINNGGNPLMSVAGRFDAQAARISGPLIYPSSGGGLELLSDGSVSSGIQSYNRSTSAWMDVALNGRNVNLGPQGGIVNAAGTLTVGAASVANSPGAPLAIVQATGPRICVYDAGGGNFFGIGINGGEMYLATAGVLMVRQNSGGGAPLMQVTSGGQVIATSHLWAGAAQIIGWAGSAGARNDLMNFGPNDSLANAQGSSWLLRRNYDNTTLLQVVGNGNMTVVGGIVSQAGSIQSAGGVYYLQNSNVVISSDATNMFVQALGGYVALRVAVSAYIHNPNASAYAPIAASAFNVNSTRKIKDNIRVLEQPLDLVMDDRLHGVRYTEKSTGRARVGFVAEDFADILPELVENDEHGRLGFFNYDQLGAVTWEALKQYVQRTDARIAELERRLAA